MNTSRHTLKKGYSRARGIPSWITGAADREQWVSGGQRAKVVPRPSSDESHRHNVVARGFGVKSG